MIEPQRRRYEPDGGGPPRRAVRRDAAVGRHAAAVPVDPRQRRSSPASTATTEVDLPVTCTYDFEVAAAKYLHGLDDGEIPLLLLFSGTVFRAPAAGGFGGRAGRVARGGVATACRSQVWRDVMDLYFPNSGWLRVSRDTLDALTRFKAGAGPADVGGGLRAAAQGSRGGGRVTRRPDVDATAFAAARAGGRRRALRGLRALPVPRVGPRRTSCAGSSACSRRRRTPRPTAPSARRCAPRSSSTPAATPGVACASGACRCSTARSRRRDPTAPSRRSTCSPSTACSGSPWDEAVEHELDVGRAAAPAGRPTRRSTVPVDLAAGDEHRAAADSRGPGRRSGRAPARAGRRRWSRSTTAWADGHRGPASRSPSRSRTAPTGAGRAAPAGTRSCAGRSSPCTRCSPSTTARSSRCSTRPTSPRRRSRAARNDGTFPVLVGRRGRRRRRAVVADHPLRPPRGRPGEPGRPLRRHRDRRDPRPAGAHPHRRGEGRGARHRPPAAAIVDRCDDMPPEVWERLHGAVRSIGPRRSDERAEPTESLPWWEPAVDAQRRPVDRHHVDRRGRGRQGHAGSPAPLAAGRRPRPLPRRPDGHGRRRVPRRRRRRAPGRHPRRRPGRRAVRVAGPLPVLPPRRGRGARARRRAASR